MTDTQKALDELRQLTNLAANYAPECFYQQIKEKSETIKAALEAKAVDVEELKEPTTAIRLTDYSKGYGDGWNRCIDHLHGNGYLSAPKSVPNGFVLVPIEPTREMIKAAWFMQYLHHGGDAKQCEELSEMRISDRSQFISDTLAYQAMIQAAQE